MKLKMFAFRKKEFSKSHNNFFKIQSQTCFFCKSKLFGQNQAWGLGKDKNSA